jgi:2-succinyl-6-hydroxy-2,4-cyclohexadiene-1-carboxylate synthase
MKLVVDEVSYHIEVCGEGFPLIMLHGFTGSGASWKPFCSTLGKESKLIMPDLIGHGATKTDSIEGEKYFVTSVVEHIIQILDRLEYEKVDILGYSMGGRVALALSVLYPSRVRNLILESASPGLKTMKERKERIFSDMRLGMSILQDGLTQFVDYWENIPLFESQKSLPLRIRKKIRNQRLSHDPTKLANALWGMSTGMQPSFWEDLDRIEANVLMIVGDLDEKFCKIAEEMQKLMKNGQIYKVEQCGHAIHVEQPEKFGTIVSEFLLNT